MFDKLLRKYSSESDPVALLTALVAAIRPRRAGNVAQATRRLRALTDLLAADDECRALVRTAIINLIGHRRHLLLYVESGILPNSGFFSETARRVNHKLLPEEIDPTYLRDAVRQIFGKPGDALWVKRLAGSTWLGLFAALRFDDDEEFGQHTLPYAIGQLLEALQVLSFHISAIGLDPELIHVDPRLENVDSAFLSQNETTRDYVAAYAAWWADPEAPWPNSVRLEVQLGQCREVIRRIRAHAAEHGTSVRLTFTLERLRQHLNRSEELLELLGSMGKSRTLAAAGPALAKLFAQLVAAECRRNNLRHYWRQNISLLAMRITENAKRTGEHYITERRDDYFALLRSALGAGFIIAFMAAIKILMGKLHAAPLVEGLMYCLNYGLGFVLIHMLHFTVATKQPAMTANALAASIQDTGNGGRSLDDLTTLIARTTRSQLAAIFGNLVLTVPTAIAIGLGWYYVFGHHFVDTAKAATMLKDIDPFSSGAFFFAMNAGFCLFLSGLIAGYYDNAAAYNRIPQRLLQLNWPRRLFGEARMRRFAAYIDRNLGALAGNFYFGFLLGGMSTFGLLIGLPIDIRHITFSATNVAYALVAFDFEPDRHMLAMGVFGVAVIGLTNLAVSFALALLVALRARGVTALQGTGLVGKVLHRLLLQPRQFLLPPRREKAGVSANL
ncbi:MAG: site-specific recombinase [Burkholderiaceae bacterium]